MPGPRFSWHRLVATEGADQLVALESGGAAIKFSGQCPYSGVQGTDTQGFTDDLTGCHVVGFARPAQYSVQEVTYSLLCNTYFSLKHT